MLETPTQTLRFQTLPMSQVATKHESNHYVPRRPACRPMPQNDGFANLTIPGRTTCRRRPGNDDFADLPRETYQLSPTTCPASNSLATAPNAGRARWRRRSLCGPVRLGDGPNTGRANCRWMLNFFVAKRPERPDCYLSPERKHAARTTTQVPKSENLSAKYGLIKLLRIPL